MTGESPETIHRFVCPLPKSARVRVADEGAVEEGVEYAIERVVEEPVAYARLVDVAGLWVRYFEVAVTAMLICSRRKVVVKNENILHEISLKFLHISAFSFPLYELSPRFKEIIYRDDILIGMSALDSLKRPPPALLPVLEHAKAGYKTWLIVHRKMARSERFGIGDRIDVLWLDLLDSLRKAAYSSINQKLSALEEALRAVDAVRFFIQIAWESGLMAQSHFISLGKDIEEIGRMVGGWRRGILAKKPAPL